MGTKNKAKLNDIITDLSRQYGDIPEQIEEEIEDTDSLDLDIPDDLESETEDLELDGDNLFDGDPSEHNNRAKVTSSDEDGNDSPWDSELSGSIW